MILFHSVSALFVEDVYLCFRRSFQTCIQENLNEVFMVKSCSVSTKHFPYPYQGQYFSFLLHLWLAFGFYINTTSSRLLREFYNSSFSIKITAAVMILIWILKWTFFTISIGSLESWNQTTNGLREGEGEGNAFQEIYYIF